MKKSRFIVLFLGIIIFIQLGVILAPAYSFDLSKKVETETVDDMISNTERRLSDLYFLKAKKLFVHRNYVESLKYLEKDKFAPPDFIDCLTKVVDYNEKISKNPKDYRLYIELANIHSQANNDEPQACLDYQLSIGLYTKALELNPKATEVYELRGDARNKTLVDRRWSANENDEQEKIFKKDVDLIIADYEKAISIYGETDKLLQKLAGNCLTNKYYEKALTIIEKIKLNDGSKFFATALCYDGLNEPKKAIEYYDLALKTPLEGDEQPDKWAIKHLYSLRAKNHFKLLHFVDWLNDYVRSLPFT